MANAVDEARRRRDLVAENGANELNSEQMTVVTDGLIFVDVGLAGDAA